MTERTTPALRFEGLTKSFGSAAVLRDVSFDVAPGEIHALLGVNGAGKSTLIKILAGVVEQDSGSIAVHGNTLPPRHTATDAREAGIAFVHQDLGLVDGLTVADNLALLVGFEQRWHLIDDRTTNQKIDGLLRDVGATFSASRLVGSLSRDEQVLCAVARAFALDPRIIVLDEVSASLPAPEMTRLAASLRSLRREGTAFIYVTHRLDELNDLVDRVTVLRDGRPALTAPIGDVSHDELVHAIVGASVTTIDGSVVPARPADGHTVPLLQVIDATSSGLVDPMSFEVRPGEVLGICGLVGSGTRALARLLGGTDQLATGAVLLDGEPLHLHQHARRQKRGFSFVPGNRPAEGLFTGLTVRENFLPSRRAYGAWTRSGFRLPRIETRRILELNRQFEVHPGDDADREITDLSGGNQQKIVFARALGDRPRIAVLEDPTAGVDIGSRAALHELIQECAAAGTGIILISTDFDEVASQSHRVLVMQHGRVAHEISDTVGLSDDRLAQASYADDIKRSPKKTEVAGEHRA